jgi:paraquat-inducible protein B
MNFFLELMRMLHMIVGITPAKPEHERMFLLLWVVALVAIVAGAVLLALTLMTHVIH